MEEATRRNLIGKFRSIPLRDDRIPTVTFNDFIIVAWENIDILDALVELVKEQDAVAKVLLGKGGSDE